MQVARIFASAELDMGLLALGLVLVASLLRSWYYASKIRRLERELSHLRIIVGRFSEADIENVLRQAVSLEVQRDRDGAVALFRLVAEKSRDRETVRLAASRVELLSSFRPPPTAGGSQTPA